MMMISARYGTLWGILGIMKSARMLEINASVPNLTIARRCAVWMTATPLMQCDVTRESAIAAVSTLASHRYNGVISVVVHPTQPNLVNCGGFRPSISVGGTSSKLA